MIRYSLLLFPVIVSGIGIGHAQITSADNVKTDATMPAISLTLTAQPVKMKLGGSIELKVIVTNLTGEKILVGAAPGNFGERDYEVFAVDENGDEAPDTAYYRHITGRRLPTDPRFLDGSRNIRLIDQAGTIATTIKLDTVRTLNHTGTYTVWVERLDGISKSRVKSNTISVVVTE